MLSGLLIRSPYIDWIRAGAKTWIQHDKVSLCQGGVREAAIGDTGYLDGGPSEESFRRRLINMMMRNGNKGNTPLRLRGF